MGYEILQIRGGSLGFGIIWRRWRQESSRVLGERLIVLLLPVQKVLREEDSERR
jgi:hypothetical protein